ncbi:hypothetical protein [Arthrobacter sp. zg-Y1110]|uniref:hypothetical protein n=1 Tax=Arthrobacter sp. zg-Y1110 TaxID=2886932 RepID=UPI0027DF16BE|nr:hypothetical protein [Arthrobacter sp. zg-Y1110]
MKLSHIPLRLTTGAYILNSGLNKRNMDAENAAYLQQMAANAFPQVQDIEPAKFGKLISTAEICVGLSLLIPFVPSRLAGLMLGCFSGGMVRMYLMTPGMTEADGIRPTPDGLGLAKDTWMAGIAAALVLDRKRPKTKVKVVTVPTPVMGTAAAVGTKGAAKGAAKAAKTAKAAKADKHAKAAKVAKVAKAAAAVKVAKAAKDRAGKHGSK